LDKEIIVASTRDWCTTSLASRLTKNGYKVFVVSADRSFGALRLGILFLPLRFVAKLTRDSYYLSFAIRVETVLFDLIIAMLILIRRPKAAILWSGMSRFSLKACSLLNIPSILWVGEEGFQSSMGRNIFSVPKFWIYRQNEEVRLARQIWVESSFVRDSLPLNVRNKTRILLTHISPNFFQRIKTSSELVEISKEKIRLGLVGCSRRKNVPFALKVAGEVSKVLEVDLDLFGFKSNFHAEGLAEAVSVQIHPYFSDTSAFISELEKCDLILVPSTSDAGPRSLVEAAVLGKQIICSPNTIGPDISYIFKNIHVCSLNYMLWSKLIESLIEKKRGISLDSNSAEELEAELDRRLQSALGSKHMLKNIF
jgi:hypothetical protein